jgi:thiol-disulfide isomerase/thioredoxin
MKYLMTQEEFEVLIGRAEPTEEIPPPPEVSVVYFTATWCGPCRSVRTAELEEGLKGVQWLKCDVDQNNYTPGYCEIRSIPTFLVIKNKKILGKFSSTSTETILANVTRLLNGEELA